MSEMTKKQHAVVAELLRSREPVVTATRLVLVEGKTNPEAQAQTGMAPAALSNALTRYRNAHNKILSAYK